MMSYPFRPLSKLWTIFVLITVFGLTAKYASASEPPHVVLTTAAQVRALSFTEARKGIPAHLQGVYMGEADPEGIAFVIQDKTDGIYVQGPPAQVAGLSRGDLLDMTGVSNPGGFAPFLVAHSIRKIGRRPVPPPIRVSLDELNAGNMDAKWVELTGIVRSVKPTRPTDLPPPPPGTRYSPPPKDRLLSTERKVKIKLAEGNARVIVEIPGDSNPEKYVDAEIRLRGLCFNLHNRNRQFVKPFVQVPHGVKIVILQPPPTKPFSTPPTPVASLFRFEQLAGIHGHRVHIRGTVVYQRPGSELWVRDGAQSIRVESTQKEVLHPGDGVDVLGFPAFSNYSPELKDATFRRRSSQQVLQPHVLTDISSALSNDADLVQLAHAKLSDVRRFSDSIQLTLDWQETNIRATMDLPENGRIPANWLPGSVVRVTGVCSVRTDEAGPLGGLWEPSSFDLLLRSPADLAVIQPAPWWNAERIAWVLSGLLVIAVGSVAAVMLVSRRRLKDQDHRRAMAETEFAAILSERNRLAREIHDTLSQNLGAISVQLELTRTHTAEIGPSALHHIGAAHQLARVALADARESIWNMRSHVLERHDLGEALEGILARLTDGTSVTPHMQVEGNRRRLSPVVENNLLRIGQEAITNASKYAKSTRIDVTLTFAGRTVRLTVEDDGVGFVADAQTNGKRHIFGLVGIRERAELLGGTAEITSAPGMGTRVTVNVSV